MTWLAAMTALLVALDLLDRRERARMMREYNNAAERRHAEFMREWDEQRGEQR